MTPRCAWCQARPVTLAGICLGDTAPRVYCRPVCAGMDGMSPMTGAILLPISDGEMA